MKSSILQKISSIGIILAVMFTWQTQPAFAANKIGSVTLGVQTPSPVTAGNAATFAVTINRGSNGDLTTALSITTALPAGVAALFSPASVDFATNQAATAISTLTFTTTNVAAAGTVPFTVKAENTKGDPADFTTTNGSLVIATAVADTTPPVISAHSNITGQQASSSTGAAVAYTSPSTTDNVDSASTATCTPASGAIFPLGVNTVTCNAQDTAGNSAVPTTFTISVVDTTAPSFTVHPDVNAVASDSDGAIVSYTNPVATDAVDSTVTIDCLLASGSLFPVGTTEVNCTATDDYNNVSSTSFDVIVAAPPASGRTITSTITPITVVASTTQSFTITLANTSSTAEQVNFASISVPNGFTINGPIILGGSSTNWTGDFQADTINLSQGGITGLISGENLTATFSGTAPAATGAAEWTTQAWTSTDQSGSTFSLTGIQPITTVIPVPALTGLIEGLVFIDSNGNGEKDLGEEGVTDQIITLSSSEEDAITTTTDASGNYSFTALADGTYTVCQTMESDWFQSLPVSGADCTDSLGFSATISDGNGIADLAFGNYQKGSIAGVVFNDSNNNGLQDENESGLSGRTLNLFASSDTETPIATVDSAIEGSYAFMNVSPGDYIIKEVVPSGWDQTAPANPSQYDISITSAQTAVSKNFGNKLSGNGSSGGSSTPTTPASTEPGQVLGENTKNPEEETQDSTDEAEVETPSITNSPANPLPRTFTSFTAEDQGQILGISTENASGINEAQAQETANDNPTEEPRSISWWWFLILILLICSIYYVYRRRKE
jgi:hypothetical protein